MSNQHTSITNQKLSAAKKHFSCLDHLDFEAPKLLVTAYQDSIVFQLQLACDSFAQEIAIDYQMSIAKQIGFIELARLLEEKETPCSHCSQLAFLQENNLSWLYWLQGRYARCWEKSDYLSPYQTLETNLQLSKSLISVADISDKSDEQWLRQCIDEFSQVISDYRELMQQW